MSVHPGVFGVFDQMAEGGVITFFARRWRLSSWVMEGRRRRDHVFRVAGGLASGSLEGQHFPVEDPKHRLGRNVWFFALRIRDRPVVGGPIQCRRAPLAAGGPGQTPAVVAPRDAGACCESHGCDPAEQTPTWVGTDLAGRPRWRPRPPSPEIVVS